MISTPKPNLSLNADTKHARLGQRRRTAMTLIAAFRSAKGGVLLCSDRQEDDGISKREVDKSARISLWPCDVFLAGSGIAAVIKDTTREIAETFWRFKQAGKNVLAEHGNILESSLKGDSQKTCETSGIVAAPLGYRGRSS